jgi:hypothetical protein
MVSCGPDSFGKGEAPVAGSCEYNYEPWSSIHCVQFLEQPSDY